MFPMAFPHHFPRIPVDFTYHFPSVTSGFLISFPQWLSHNFFWSFHLISHIISQGLPVAFPYHFHSAISGLLSFPKDYQLISNIDLTIKSHRWGKTRTQIRAPTRTQTKRVFQDIIFGFETKQTGDAFDCLTQTLLYTGFAKGFEMPLRELLKRRPQTQHYGGKAWIDLFLA